MNRVTSSEIEVGVRRLDVEHAALLRELDQLTGGARRSVDELRSSLAFLSHHVSEHFLEEERYMVAADYPGIEAHRLEHERLAVFTSDAQDLLEHDPNAEELSRTVRSLAGQLTRHMQDADRVLAHYLRGAGE